MFIEDYVSGHYEACFQYHAFIPSTINHAWQWRTPHLSTALEETARELALLDAFSRFIPNINLFIRMHAFQEASSSSKIEGTQTEIDEALLPSYAISEERRNDWQEVNNYVSAMDVSLEELKKLPLSIRLLRFSHKHLLRGVRGEQKAPGEIRHSQNWIGGSSLCDAHFIPPPPTELPRLLTDLEFFWHNDKIEVPHLIRIAISHYQFETIHPFLDGNGRIGRLLIPFYLIDKGLLTVPSLYISSFFEKHRQVYYEKILHTQKHNDLLSWIFFFLEAVCETSKTGIATFQKIVSFQEQMKLLCSSKGVQAHDFQAVVNSLYLHPRSTIKNLIEQTHINPRTVYRVVEHLVKDGLLVPFSKQKRNCIFDFKAYLSLFSQK